MSGKVWLGSIFIKEEGGFDIIMRALNHYNRRLHRISGSPEIAGAAMLGSVLQSESVKTASRLRPIADRMRAGLAGDATALAALEDDIEMIEKAMVCYGSDARKAAEGAHPYYAALVEGNAHHRDDVRILDDCIRRLKRYG